MRPFYLSWLSALCLFAFFTDPLPVSIAASPAQQSPGPLVSSNAAPLSLKDGEVVVLWNLTPLSSATSKVGNTVKFEVAKTVSVGGLVVIPRHALALGTLIDIKKKHSKGHGGKIAVRIDSVQSVTGQSFKLRGQDQRNVNTARGNDIAALEAQTLGFGFLTIPWILLAPGPEMIINPGTRFVAYLDGEQKLNREALTQAQASIPTDRQDVAEVYIYATATNNDYSQITCGNTYLGLLQGGRYIHLELPAGLYWIRTGPPLGRLNKEDPAYFFQLRVENGRTYYLKHAIDREPSAWIKGGQAHFELADETIGAAEIAELSGPAKDAVQGVSEKMLPYLRGQVTTKPKAKTKSRDQ